MRRTAYILPAENGILRMDAGQTEAALSLGYSDRKAFFRVVLPQALPHIMPSCKGQITSLIKATAIVGYVAVIYFILAAALKFVVNRLEPLIDPRKRKSLLKGVKTGD